MIPDFRHPHNPVTHPVSGDYPFIPRTPSVFEMKPQSKMIFKPFKFEMHKPKAKPRLFLKPE
jgi:hypothetical protein